MIISNSNKKKHNLRFLTSMSFFLYFRDWIRLPFDWKQTLPYIVLMIIQILSVFFVQAVYISASSLYTGVCVILTAFNIDICTHLRQLNRIVIANQRIAPREKIDTSRHMTQKSFRRREIKWRIEQQVEIKQKLLGLIEFHANARQWALRVIYVLHDLVRDRANLLEFI